MTQRDVVIRAIEGNNVPYVPWHCSFTAEAAEKLRAYYKSSEIDRMIGNHFLTLGDPIGFFTDIGENKFRDVFGVTWDRSVDRDIGVVSGCVLSEPTLTHYVFPDPCDERFFCGADKKIAEHDDLYRVFVIGFSLYERAWTLRGMENLMMDFYENPGFVHELLSAITDYNIAQIKRALTYNIDAVHFGDDWGQQQGLQMGPALWRTFILPQLRRMYSVVKAAGKHVSIHSCGDVDELFDDLVNIGLNLFNPFQPEVMDVFSLMKKYRGRLAFHGGLSTQKTLPWGSVADVRNETQRLLDAGRNGGYIFAPAHAVEGDVPLENMLAFIEMLQTQPGYERS
ncbi:MAG: uroporphyrinogen decarboxylase family protein [Planctomycetales bacterium]|nr:uroporphyrinogen decarboxylase family protein [Planctomycetales bacterium]